MKGTMIRLAALTVVLPIMLLQDWSAVETLSQRIQRVLR